jgi:hypothetical protein
MHIEGPATSVSHPIDESYQLCVFLSEADVLAGSSIFYVYEICFDEICL